MLATVVNLICLVLAVIIICAPNGRGVKDGD